MSLPRMLSEGNKDYDDGMESMNVSSLLSSVSASPSFGSIKETKSSSFASTVVYSDLNDEIINNNTCDNDSFDWYLPFPNENKNVTNADFNYFYDDNIHNDDNSHDFDENMNILNDKLNHLDGNSSKIYSEGLLKLPKKIQTDVYQYIDMDYNILHNNNSEQNNIIMDSENDIHMEGKISTQNINDIDIDISIKMVVKDVVNNMILKIENNHNKNNINSHDNVTLMGYNDVDMIYNNDNKMSENNVIHNTLMGHENITQNGSLILNDNKPQCILHLGSNIDNNKFIIFNDNNN